MYRLATKRTEKNESRQRQPLVHWFIAHYLLLRTSEDRHRDLCSSRLSALRFGAFTNSTQKNRITIQA